MDRIVPHPSALAELVELHPLELEAAEPLAHEDVAAEVALRLVRRALGGRRKIGGNAAPGVERRPHRADRDAARKEAHGRPHVDLFVGVARIVAELFWVD